MTTMNLKRLARRLGLGAAFLVMTAPSGFAALTFSKTFNSEGNLIDTDYDGAANSLSTDWAAVVGNADWTPGEHRLAMEFALGDVTGSTINDATLELKANWYTWYKDDPYGGVIQVDAYLADGTVDLNDFSRTGQFVWSGVSDYNASPAYGKLSLDVTNALQWAKDNASAHIGFLFRNTSVTGANSKLGRGWYIKEYPNSPSTSYVELHGTASATAVPEPSSLLSATLGLVGLAGYARRRRVRSMKQHGKTS